MPQSDSQSEELSLESLVTQGVWIQMRLVHALGTNCQESPKSLEIPEKRSLSSKPINCISFYMIDNYRIR